MTSLDHGLVDLRPALQVKEIKLCFHSCILSLGGMYVPSPQHSCKTHIHIEEQISEKENKPHHPIKQLTK